MYDHTCFTERRKTACRDERGVSAVFTYRFSFIAFVEFLIHVNKIPCVRITPATVCLFDFQTLGLVVPLFLISPSHVSLGSIRPC